MTHYDYYYKGWTTEVGIVWIKSFGALLYSDPPAVFGSAYSTNRWPARPAVAFDDPQFAASPPKARTLIHMACLAALGDAPPAFS